MSNKNLIDVRVDSSVGYSTANIADVLLYLQQVDVFRNDIMGIKCELDTSHAYMTSHLTLEPEVKVEYKAWVEHPVNYYGEVLYLGYDSSMHTPLLFKVTIKQDNGTDYLLLSSVDEEQLSVENFIDKTRLPCITRSIIAKRSALRLRSLVFSRDNSIKYAFDMLTDTIYLPKCAVQDSSKVENTWVNLGCVSTKLKSLVGDASRQNFTHTGSYDEDIDLHMKFINEACELMGKPEDFNFCYTISLRRDAQV